MYVCVSVVCVDRTRPRRRVCVRTVSQYGERTDHACTFWKTYTVGDGTNRIHGCFVVECMESLCVYIVVHAHRANAFIRACVCMGTGRWEWMDGWMRGIRAFTSSVVDARGDGRERRANRDDRHRSHRTSLSFPSLSRLDRSIRPTNSSHFIHSFIPLRPKGRAKERPEGRDRRGTRPTRDARSSTRDASVRIARGERGTRVSNARRVESRIHCVRAF